MGGFGQDRSRTRTRRLGLAIASLGMASLLSTPSAGAPLTGWKALATELLQPVAQDGQLPNSSIPMAMASDPRGFLWVGTQNGLARWDGQQFRVFNIDAGRGALPDGQIETLHTDRAGRLWVGTLSGGFARYDPRSDRFTSYSTGAGLSHVGVHALADSADGGLWIGTEAGLDELVGKAGRIRHVADLNPRQRDVRQALTSGVTALASDSDGAVWIGTQHGLLRRDPRSGVISPVRLIDAEAPLINTLTIASDGRLWVGTDGRGAYVVDRTTQRATPVAATLKNGLTGSGMRVRALLEVSPGEIWLGTYDDGLLAVDPVTLEAHRLRLGNGSLLYGDQNIRALHRGPGGLVFIASNSAITRYDPRHEAFTTLLGGQAPTATLADRTPVSIFRAESGRIWVGYTSRGVDLIDPQLGRITHAGLSVNGFPRAPIRKIAGGTQGAVFLGTDAGLFRSDADAGPAHLMSQPGRASDARVQDLLRDGQRLWLAGRNGVWGYQLGRNDALSPYRVIPSDRLTDRRVDVLTLDPSGDLWIGTDNGLNRYDPRTGRVEQLTPGRGDEATPRGFISNVTIDSAGRLWVATFGHGVSVADPVPAGRPLRFHRISVLQGLPNSNANRILEDRQGYIWVSTDSGLARIDPRTLQVRAFQLAEGVPIGSFFYNAGVRTPSGELVFAGRGGLEVVRPDLLKPIKAHAPLVVTEVRVHGRLLPGDPFLGMGARGSLQIHPGDGGFEVGFAALDYGAPERVRYAYRLLGVSRAWTEADASRRLAAFNNLAPGRYQLEIRASDPSQTWAPQLLRLPVTVLPAWNQTLWFQLLEVLASIAVVLLLVRWRTAHLQHRRRELESLVAERTQVLEAQAVELAEARLRAEAMAQSKSDFLANMSHEIRTPLNGVVAVADLLTRSALPEKERGMAEIIRSSGDTLQRLLSDILDMARIESGKITIECAPFDVDAMVRSVAGLSQLKCDEKGVQLAVDVSPQIDRLVFGDMVRVRQVVTNLLSNAVKFTEKGEVRLSVERVTPARMRFTVTDTGVGFAMSDKSKVLGRFEQADSSITRRFGGTGLGLSICCDLAGLMGGVLDCEGELGRGARFWMELPLAPAAEEETRDAAANPAAGEMEDRLMRILLADDHPTNRKVVELMLHDGLAELTMVEDGRQAVDAFQMGGFDVVLMDMQMPVMDGLSAIAEIRRLELAGDLRRTPVIMLTANALPEHVAEARAVGADLHLAKPFTAQALFDAINLALSTEEALEAAA